MSELINITALNKNYGKAHALKDINITIESGHIIGLLGPNGSGKTTLIKILTGLLAPTSGSVLVKGKPIGVESKKVISYLPDTTYLNMNQKISEIISFFKTFYDDFDENKAYAMLEKLNIDSNTKLITLSKGTKEKVQLILVMSRKADIYILDEPIAGVDPAARDYILNTILSNYDEEATIIISSHIIADIENILDQVIMIKAGSIERFSSVEDIRENEHKSLDTLFREVYRC